jgi:hypothetical protein
LIIVNPATPPEEVSLEVWYIIFAQLDFMSYHNLNEDIPVEQLREAVLSKDWPALSHLRYTEGDPGAACVIESLDVSGFNLSGMPTDFICFKNCKMNGASLSGVHFFPFSLWACDAQGLDLRNTSGMLFAFETDLRGALFDDTTRLVVKNSDLPSAFKDCKMDDDFRDFLVAQGALLDFPAGRSIESYAFGKL